jgi:hypothetical protein
MSISMIRHYGPNVSVTETGHEDDSRPDNNSVSLMDKKKLRDISVSKVIVRQVG